MVQAMKRLVMDIGKDYTLTHDKGRTDIHFTLDGQLVLAAQGVLMGADCPPFKMTHAGTDMLVVQVFEWNQARDAIVQAAVEIVKRQTVVESAKCFGYYGFGTGFLKGKMDLAIIGKGFPVAIYCADTCQVGVECCLQHRLRCDNLGLDSDQASVDNCMDGEAAARGEELRNRAEATLTWPLKIIQSVIRAN